MDNNSMLRRLEMYAMINSIENDLVENLSTKLKIDDISSSILEKAQNVSNKNDITSVLRGLDLQGYIEIINENILKLEVNEKEKKFFNNDFSKIIPIRNKVMHPRLFDFYDYPMLKSCFCSLENSFSCFTWKNVSNAIRMINEEPSLLTQYEINLKKSNNIIENLPTTVDFEDTSFIGRDKEIGEIKGKLYKKNVHILTIIGDGGVGKTALTIKLLYDLLDDEKNPFELILWVSLKTRELNKYEFTEIQNSITDVSRMYQHLGDFIGVESNGKNIQNELIDISKKFKTLLVLDNLETINTDDVREFLEEFSEEGKVIITSRIGLGEMEHRYPLRGLSDDDLELYTDTLLNLHNKEHCFSQTEKMNYVKNELHANPLAIKWFIRGMANGQSTQELLKNKGELIDFCMSNVYDKLSDMAKKVLSVLKIARAELSLAEMFFVIEKQALNEPDIRAAVNELCKCNFLNSDVFRLNSLLSITEFASEFIRKHMKDDSQLEGQVKQKLKELYSFDQRMIEMQSNEPYKLNTFHYIHGEKDRTVAAYYLSKAVDSYYRNDIDDAFINIDIAKSLCPQYFECNKIAAYFLRTSDPQKALDEYEIAMKNVSNNDELRLVYISYKEFCVSNNDYHGALEMLDKAIEIKDEIRFQLEKAKILSYCGKYENAHEILNQIEESCLKTPKYKEHLLARRADVYRRQSESVKDYKERFEILKKASEPLVAYHQRTHVSLSVLGNIVKELLHIGFDVTAATYAYDILNSVDKRILKTFGIKELRTKMNSLKNNIALFDKREDLLSMLVDYNEIAEKLSGKQAIVYNIVDDRFGFVKNRDYPKGIYFMLQDVGFKVQLGDIVELGQIYQTSKGDMTREIELKNASL